MEGGFSRELKNVIAESREVALELGYDHISTLHILLADCRLNQTGSIRNFAFATPDHFDTFFESARIGPSYSTAFDLPLTVEAEKAITKAFRFWNRSDYIDQYVQPYHLFLAAASFPHSMFSQEFQSNPNLFDDLESYYVKIGQTSPDKIHRNWVEKIRRRWAYKWFNRKNMISK